MSLCCRMDFKNFWRDARAKRRRSTINPKIQLGITGARGHLVCFILNVVPFFFALFSFSRSFTTAVSAFPADIRQLLHPPPSVSPSRFNFCSHHLFILPFKFKQSLFILLTPARKWILIESCRTLITFCTTNPTVIIRNGTACIHVMHIYREPTIDCHLRLQY